MQSNCNIHIEYNEEHYDGDMSIECKVTYSCTDVNDKITVSYEADSIEVLQTQISENIIEYIRDPEKWTKQYILDGDDNRRKLQALQEELASFQHDIEYHRRNAEKYESYRRTTEGEIKALRIKILNERMEKIKHEQSITPS